MPEARPFIGLMYDPAVAGSLDALTTPPYDVISAEDQERFHGESPYNVIRLILGRDDADLGDSGQKYTRAASHLSEWRDRGVLRPTQSPTVYPYQLDFRLGGAERRVRGVLVEIELEPLGGSVVPHERTLAGPIEDRLHLLRAVQANLSPVYAVLVRPSSDALGAFLDEQTAIGPDLQLTDDAGTTHRVWVAATGWDEALQEIRNSRLMIADGHHRYTVALAHRDEMRARHGAGPWDAMMTMVVDARAENPPVLPIHRVVMGGALPEAPRGDPVRDLAEVLATVSDDDLTLGVVAIEDGRLIHRIASLPGVPPVVCALHEQILDRAPNIALRFEPDAARAEQAVGSGVASAAYVLPPTQVDRVWNLVSEGKLLPQKSTYFWPKPRTGLVTRPFWP